MEDCAQAHGAKWRDQVVGSFGDIATFSFFPGKNLGALGDAGAVCSNNIELISLVRKLANHGRETKFGHDIFGRNSRLDTIHAAVLQCKLSLLPQWNKLRQENAQFFDARFSSFATLETLQLSDFAESVYHQYVIRTDNRDELKKFLAAKDIETGIHYPQTINQYEAFKSFVGETAEANSQAGRIISLPVHQYLSINDKERICQAVEEFFNV